MEFHLSYLVAPLLFLEGQWFCAKQAWNFVGLEISSPHILMCFIHRLQKCALSFNKKRVHFGGALTRAFKLDVWVSLGWMGGGVTWNITGFGPMDGWMYARWASKSNCVHPIHVSSSSSCSSSSCCACVCLYIYIYMCVWKSWGEFTSVLNDGL